MRTSLRTRLAWSYLAVLLAQMVIVIPLAWLAVERLYLDTQRVNLLEQARLAAATLHSGELPAQDALPYAQAANVLPGIHTRLLDLQGALVIDLATPGGLAGTAFLPPAVQQAAGLVTAEELLARPEILQALQGHPASAVRGVPVAGGRQVLYAAAPVLSAGGMVTRIVYLATPLPDTRWGALPTSMRWQFAAVLVGALLLAGGAGWLLSRRIARPLGDLARAAQSVAAGDLGQQVPEDAAIVELAALGRSFNTMTCALRQADQAKTAFVADVSHELRTPLTVIKGTIETLQDGALDDLAARGPFLEAMSRETERLIRLVNDLLVLTRADAGVLNLHLQPLDLAEMVRQRCERLAGVAAQRRVRLQPVVSPALVASQVCRVLADPDRLAQVLDNLLENAIRYSPLQGMVQVVSGRADQRVVCQVIDAGPGIPARHLPLIFDRFYRVDPARGRQQGGSGLGLAIVRGLVLAQGGQVAADSQEGQGTTITFWLPAAPD